MTKRDENWLKASKDDPHEARFAMNLDKLPRVYSKVKRGECLDSFGAQGSTSVLDMAGGQRSRADSKIIHHNQDLVHNFSEEKIPYIGNGKTDRLYDVNYSLVDINDNSNYKSQFLRNFGQRKDGAEVLCDRFDACQYRTNS